jgi:hypothetical protein
VVDTSGQNRYVTVSVSEDLVRNEAGPALRKIVRESVLHRLNKVQPTSGVIWRIERLEEMQRVIYLVKGFAGPKAVVYAERERQHRKSHDWCMHA